MDPRGCQIGQTAMCLEIGEGGNRVARYSTRSVLAAGVWCVTVAGEGSRQGFASRGDAEKAAGNKRFRLEGFGRYGRRQRDSGLRGERAGADEKATLGEGAWGHMEQARNRATPMLREGRRRGLWVGISLNCEARDGPENGPCRCARGRRRKIAAKPLRVTRALSMLGTGRWADARERFSTRRASGSFSGFWFLVSSFWFPVSGLWSLREMEQPVR